MLQKIKEAEDLPKGNFVLFIKDLPRDKRNGLYLKFVSPFKYIGEYVDSNFKTHKNREVRNVYLLRLRFPKYKKFPVFRKHRISVPTDGNF